MKGKFKRLKKRVFKTLKKSEMSILPGQLAFFFVLSVIPLIALIGSITVAFGMNINDIIKILQDFIPKAVIELLLPILTGEGVSFNMIVFYISAFILASNGMHSMIITSNTIYKFKNKDYLARRIKALLMTVILVMLLLFILIVPAYGDKIVNTIISFISNDIIARNIKIIFTILKYPLSFLIIFFNVKLIYVLAPDETIKSRETTYGSLFTTFGWVIATEVYSIYVDVFAKYNIFYGSLSNIIILLMWVYILAYIFVLGMALNSGFREEKEIVDKS